MADDKQDLRKGVPGGFVWFLMAAFILALMVQNFIDTKFANVSFSYQLEHLVNLDLIQPKYSRKIALNDNLVTFSGKFREQVTEEGKNRFKYLELLNTNHQLNFEKTRLEEEINGLTNRIDDSVDLFLHLSGLPVPQGGYVVVDDMFNSIDDKDHSLIIDQLSSRSIISLNDLRSEYANLAKDPQSKMVSQFGDTLMGFIRNFRSPALGIGNENIKQSLRGLDREVANISTSSSNVNLKLSVYDKAIKQLASIVEEMNASKDHVRLDQLRSVRNYKETVDEYNTLAVDLDANEAQLDKARQAVSSVVWFFNNKELSTKSLEKEDPEKFSQWFNNARKEWEGFNANRSGVFKAPDQPLNAVLEKTFKSEEPAPNYMSYMFTILPVILVVLVLYFLFSRQMKGMGSGAMNFGKSPAKIDDKRNK